MTKPRIIIIGYFGARNIGDEAILKAMTNLFYGHDISLMVRSLNPEFTSREYGVEAFFLSACNILTHVLRNISFWRNTKCLIVGGGGLLQDVTGISFRTGNIPFIFYLLILCKIFKIKFALYGLGVGPINTNYGRLLTKFIIRNADLISVRTEGDKSLIKALCGSGVKDIAVIGDPVLLLEPKVKAIAYPRKRMRIGLNVRPWFGDDNSHKQKVLSEIARFTAYLGNYYQSEVMFLPFQPKRDTPFYERIREYGGGKLELGVNIDTPERMLGCISELDFMIGMRLHSIIFSCLASVPFIALSYDPKVDFYLEELSMQSFAIPISQATFNALQNKFHYIYENKDNVKNLLISRLSILKEKAAVQHDNFLHQMFKFGYASANQRAGLG